MKSRFLAASQFAIFSLLFAGIIPIPIPIGIFDALVYYLEKRIWKLLIIGELFFEARFQFYTYQGASTVISKLESLHVPVYVKFIASIYGFLIFTSLSFVVTNYIIVRLINWYFKRKIPQLKAIVK